MTEKNFSLSEIIKQNLHEVYQNEQFPEELYPCFEEKYRLSVVDDYDNDETLDGLALESSKEYVSSIINQLELGHGMEWAKLYASCLEDTKMISSTYRELKEINERLADDEIRVHARSYRQDEYFERFFFALLTEYSSPFKDEELERFAKKYSELYKQELADGKSDCYAQKYAELKALYESPIVDESLRLIAEIFDFADQKGIDTTGIRSNCGCFADDCEEAYVNERFLIDINTLRERYTEDWQQEMLTILYNRYMDEYRKY